MEEEYDEEVDYWRQVQFTEHVSDARRQGAIVCENDDCRRGLALAWNKTTDMVGIISTYSTRGSVCSEDGIYGMTWDPHNSGWMWQGSRAELKAMAESKEDPVLRRPYLDEDYDSELWFKFYARFLRWNDDSLNKHDVSTE